MNIAFLRHGPTDWNAQGRIQGRIDIPLSEEGRAKMAALALPAAFASARCFVSPLGRALETARLLGVQNPIIDARLAEHDWGRWEGLTRDEILAADGEDAFLRAGSAADFQPPGGESTRALLDRVADFLRDVAIEKNDAVAIAHRGILRTAYTLATGWEMATPMPDKLDLSKILVLSLDDSSKPQIAKLNLDFNARTDLPV